MNCCNYNEPNLEKKYFNILMAIKTFFKVSTDTYFSAVNLKTFKPKTIFG